MHDVFVNLWAYIQTPAAIGWFIGLAMAVLPQGSDGSGWATVRSILNVLAANFGNAKNK